MMEEFASPILQESLLLDKARCDAYREAIHRAVKPGDVVVDLARELACFPSSRCKPARVMFYAIEMSRIADAAAELIEANGFQDRITLIRKNSKKCAWRERCDVLVTETLSAFSSTPKYHRVRRRRPRALLEPGARIIRSRGHISDAVFFGCLRRGPPPAPLL